jgi:hypothetical protein
LFYRRSKREKVIVNDLNDSTIDQRATIERLLYTRYESTDFLSNLPTCECTQSTGQWLADAGVICSNCGTRVTNQLEQDLEPLVWMRKPKFVKGLINPNGWTMISTRFKLKGFDVIQWYCDVNYRPPRAIPEELNQVIAITKKYPRGYNNFITNFDDIVRELLNLKVYRKSPQKKREETDALPQMIAMYRDCLFSDYLPLPNRALIVLEDTNLGTYSDSTLTVAVDAMYTMVNIDSEMKGYNERQQENRTIKTIVSLAKFYSELYAKRIAPKEGIFRKHVYGTRSHWSFRGVIQSLTDQHDYDEVHISWGIGVSVLRLHLTNKLLRMSWTPTEIDKYLNEHAQKYSSLLDRLFKELIAESPYKGIPIIFQRNPSLERGSAQAMFITKVKAEADVPTISMSILAVSGFNADFDGDQQNGTLCMDHVTTEDLQRLAPHMSTFGFDGVRTITRNLSIPKPVVTTISNWLHWKEEPLTAEQEALMDAIPEMA